MRRVLGGVGRWWRRSSWHRRALFCFGELILVFPFALYTAWTFGETIPAHLSAPCPAGVPSSGCRSLQTVTVTQIDGSGHGMWILSFDEGFGDEQYDPQDLTGVVRRHRYEAEVWSGHVIRLLTPHGWIDSGALQWIPLIGVTALGGVMFFIIPGWAGLYDPPPPGPTGPPLPQSPSGKTPPHVRRHNRTSA